MGLPALLASALALALCHVPAYSLHADSALLSSATLSTESLERIKVSLGIDREDVLVLSSSCDRPNVYQQSRRLHRRVDVWYVEYDFRMRDLHFILAGTSTRT